MMIDRIEDGFFDLLQSDVMLSIEGKKYRTGRFLNFRIKEFYIQLDLVVNDKQRHVDIPMPYEARCTSDSVSLSYKFEDMGDFGLEVDRQLKEFIGGGRSKLYNNCLDIKRINDE